MQTDLNMNAMTNNRQEKCILPALFIMGILYYISRFAMSGIPYYSPEDTYFHLNRLLGLGNVWRSPVSFLAFAGDGNYVNVFYPWLTMYPMWLLCRLCGSWVLGYKLYYLFLGTATLYTSYYSVRMLSGSPWSGFCFAVLYTFSSYRFVDVFRRASLGESIALTFLPLVLYGSYCIFLGDFRKWRLLSLAMALIAYTHLLSLFMTGLVVLAAGGVSLFLADRRQKRTAAFFQAVIGSVLLSLGSLLPMLQAARENVISHPDGGVDTLVRHADSLTDIVVNSFRNIPTAHSIGFLSLTALVLSVVMLVRCRKSESPVFRAAAIYAVSGIIFLLLSSSLAPWKVIGEHTPLRIIQFPWRLHAYTTLFSTAAFSLLAPSALSARNKRLLLTLICLASVLLHWKGIYDLHGEEEHRITDSLIISYQYDHRDYAPLPARQYCQDFGYTLDDSFLNGQKIQPECSVSEDGTVLHLSLDKSEDRQELDIPVYWYTSLRAEVNGEEVQTVMSERGTVLLTLPGTRHADIELYHVYSRLTYFSRILAILFLVLLPAPCAAERRRKRRARYPVDEQAEQ